MEVLKAQFESKLIPGYNLFITIGKQQHFVNKNTYFCLQKNVSIYLYKTSIICFYTTFFLIHCAVQIYFFANFRNRENNFFGYNSNASKCMPLDEYFYIYRQRSYFDSYNSNSASITSFANNIRQDESDCKVEPPKTNSSNTRAGQSVQVENLPDE